MRGIDESDNTLKTPEWFQVTFATSFLQFQFELKLERHEDDIFWRCSEKKFVIKYFKQEERCLLILNINRSLQIKEMIFFFWKLKVFNNKRAMLNRRYIDNNLLKSKKNTSFKKKVLSVRLNVNWSVEIWFHIST